jgi:riboflavin kinase/FMN adenylyltransferase
MRTIELTYPHSLVLEALPDTVCAIGFFDGVHKGHQMLIETAVAEAKQKKMESAVITFHPHPSVVLKKGVEHVKYITPIREKQDILQRMNVDRLYIIKFNKELSSLPPQVFIDHFIIGLNIKHLIAGFDYTYGFKGAGNMSTIESDAKGAFTHLTIDQVTEDGEKVSSTKIRKLLKAGNVDYANKLLGRPLITDGVVVKGDQRGKTLGYPTANLKVNPDALLPKIGVYAVKVFYKNETYEGMASLGLKPTFTSSLSEPVLEVNIFDYNNDLYGEELLVEWHEYIRDELTFTDVDKLVEQIAKDEKDIRQYFSQHN